jgi:KDO2-lipid IV(A) lauroyltransferase
MRRAVKVLVEYGLARSLLGFFGILPRRAADVAARVLAWLGFHFARRQRRAGLQNLRLTFPELSEQEREQILRGCFRNLGRLLVEFSRFPQLHKSNISDLVIQDGLENYLAALRRGNGVICLTAHLGAWELSSFAHSIFGYPMKFIVRQIDNPRVESLISRYRSLGGNMPIHRRNAGRKLIRALRNNETVGILFDQNTTRSEGVFVDFMGIPAATTPAVATLALRTGAAVVPGFLIWDDSIRKHRLRFDPPLELKATDNPEQDILDNTKLFNQVLEKYIRKYPDQWLWIHRRWKTRPEGDPSIY